MLTPYELILKKQHNLSHSKKEIQLSDIIFKTIDSFNNPIDIKKIKNKSWRNLLYDFERYNTMRKM